jgi:hypothetical protein
VVNRRGLIQVKVLATALFSVLSRYQVCVGEAATKAMVSGALCRQGFMIVCVLHHIRRALADSVALA